MAGNRDSKVVHLIDKIVPMSEEDKAWQRRPGTPPKLTPEPEKKRRADMRPQTAAARAARYRARKRGEDVPKRKPGPKASETNPRALRYRIAELENQLKLQKSINQQRQMQIQPLPVAAQKLLNQLRNTHGEDDKSEDQILLGDLVAAIEERRALWR